MADDNFGGGFCSFALAPPAPDVPPQRWALWDGGSSFPLAPPAPAVPPPQRRALRDGGSSFPLAVARPTPDMQPQPLPSGRYVVLNPTQRQGLESKVFSRRHDGSGVHRSWSASDHEAISKSNGRRKASDQRPKALYLDDTDMFVGFFGSEGPRDDKEAAQATQAVKTACKACAKINAVPAPHAATPSVSPPDAAGGSFGWTSCGPVHVSSAGSTFLDPNRVKQLEAQLAESNKRVRELEDAQRDCKRRLPIGMDSPLWEHMPQVAELMLRSVSDMRGVQIAQAETHCKLVLLACRCVAFRFLTFKNLILLCLSHL